jgi:division protein CdvB (Snf7/Vps24/ESCRT-III family)
LSPPNLNPFSDERGADLKDKISYAIRQIETQRKELDSLRSRLDERRRALFNATVRAIEKSDDMRARLLAGEHLELQKVTHVVSASELALLHIVVRLETLRDVGSVMFVLTTAFKEVKRIGKTISQVAPNLHQAANEINNSLSDVVAELGALTPNITIALTDTPQEIFHKAEQLIEQRTSELSEMPRSVRKLTEEEPGSSLLEKTKKIALLATADESDEDDGEGEEEFMPVLLGPEPAKPEPDEALRSYLAENGSERFDIGKVSQRLGLPSERVEQSYIKLLRQKALVENNRDEGA